jgi:rhodanese-related sulfurtransferase
MQNKSRILNAGGHEHHLMHRHSAIIGLMKTQTPMEIAPRRLKEKLDAGENVQLIDVREPQEFALCRIEGAELVPMGSIPHALESLKEKAATGQLVLYCHHGMRSLQAASWLRRQGWTECQSLQGGIDLWSVVIDPAVPRY